MVRLVKATNYVEFGPQEVFLQYAPISFDASTFELRGSLLNGAKLVVLPRGAAVAGRAGRLISRAWRDYAFANGRTVSSDGYDCRSRVCRASANCSQGERRCPFPTCAGC